MIALLIVANSRPAYLAQVLDSLPLLHPAHMFIQNDDEHAGMAANIQLGWQRALEAPWDYLLHWEDDMVLLRKPPLQVIANTLYMNPQVANIILKRQPWNDLEQQLGCVHEAIRVSAATHIQHWPTATHDGWGEHDHIFSLNPCLIPRHIVERGWPVGNEAEATAKLLADEYTFGVWGQPYDDPYIEHIGQERGPGWRL